MVGVIFFYITFLTETCLQSNYNFSETQSVVFDISKPLDLICHNAFLWKIDSFGTCPLLVVYLLIFSLLSNKEPWTVGLSQSLRIRMQLFIAKRIFYINSYVVWVNVFNYFLPYWFRAGKNKISVVIDIGVMPSPRNPMSGTKDSFAAEIWDTHNGCDQHSHTACIWSRTLYVALLTVFILLRWLRGRKLFYWILLYTYFMQSIMSCVWYVHCITKNMSIL